MTEIKSVAVSGTETAQTDSRKENLKRGLIIAGGVALAGISLFAAVKYKKKVNAVKAEQIKSQIKECERMISKPTQRQYLDLLYEITEKNANESFRIRIAELQGQLLKLERINRIF